VKLAHILHALKLTWRFIWQLITALKVIALVSGTIVFMVRLMQQLVGWYKGVP